MLNKIPLFILFFCGQAAAFAQSNYYEGYYVTLSNDTIRGYIDYRSERRNFQKCSFKSELDGKTVHLYPEDITAYSISTIAHYQRHSINEVIDDKVVSGFFKVLFTGKIDLLQYNRRYFVSDDKGNLIEVSKKIERSDIYETEDIVYNFSGVGILLNLMDDCPEITRSYLEKEYQAGPNFTSIFRKYESCYSELVSELASIKPSAHLDFGMKGSSVITRFGFLSVLEPAKFNDVYTFNLGLYTTVFIPRIDDRVQLSAEVLFGYYDGYSDFISFDTHHDLFINYSYLDLPLIATFNIGPFYLVGGLQSRVILNQSTRWRVETIVQNTVNSEDQVLEQFNTFNEGLVLGVGLKYKVLKRTGNMGFRYSYFNYTNHSQKPLIRNYEISLSVQFTK